MDRRTFLERVDPEVASFVVALGLTPGLSAEPTPLFTTIEQYEPAQRLFQQPHGIDFVPTYIELGQTYLPSLFRTFFLIPFDRSILHERGTPRSGHWFALRDIVEQLCMSRAAGPLNRFIREHPAEALLFFRTFVRNIIAEWMNVPEDERVVQYLLNLASSYGASLALNINVYDARVANDFSEDGLRQLCLDLEAFKPRLPFSVEEDWATVEQVFRFTSKHASDLPRDGKPCVLEERMCEAGPAGCVVGDKGDADAALLGMSLRPILLTSSSEAPQARNPQGILLPARLVETAPSPALVLNDHAFFDPLPTSAVA